MAIGWAPCPQCTRRRWWPAPGPLGLGLSSVIVAPWTPEISKDSVSGLHLWTSLCTLRGPSVALYEPPTSHLPQPQGPRCPQTDNYNFFDCHCCCYYCHQRYLDAAAMSAQLLPDPGAGSMRCPICFILSPTPVKRAARPFFILLKRQRGLSQAEWLVHGHAAVSGCPGRPQATGLQSSASLRPSRPVMSEGAGPCAGHCALSLVFPALVLQLLLSPWV